MVQVGLNENIKSGTWTELPTTMAKLENFMING